MSGTSPPALRELIVGDDPAAWATAGFTVNENRCRIGGITVHLAADGGRRGLRSWRFDGLADVDALDGIPTKRADPSTVVSPGPGHANGAERIDHVVLLTPDLARTTGALEAAGIAARRTRDVEPAQYGFPARQVFFRAGEAILEVIGGAEADLTRADRSARCYGLAVTVTDLDATASLLGERLGRIKDAVQPGRRIATLRHRDVGTSLALAFMSAGTSAV